MAKKKMKSMEGTCCPSGHMNCLGGGVLVLGVLILLNALYDWFDWGVFVGGVVVLKGLLLMVHKKYCK